MMAQPPLFEILDQAETALGVLCLRRRAVLSRPGTFVTEICIGHELLMSSYHVQSEQALARRALDWHGGSGLRVVVGGLGLGYTAEAALSTGRVEQLEVFELLPAVIRWLESGLVPLSKQLTSEARLCIRQGDIFADLRSPRADGTVDAILIDIDHSPDELLAGPHREFYTARGLDRASAWLAPDGVLAVWSSAANPSFVETLESAFEETRVDCIEWCNDFTDTTEVDYVFLARHNRSPSRSAPPH